MTKKHKILLKIVDNNKRVMMEKHHDDVQYQVVITNI